jgi:Asp/Glu/hydantoin racemase
MPTVAAIYTALNIVDSIKALFAELLPDVRLINIADDSLIQEVIAAGEVTPAVIRRLVAYYQAAEQAGADVILNTCSSVGEVSILGQQFVNTPIVQIDHAMAEAAVAQAETIGVLATLPTTLGPTVRLVQRKAQAAGREVSVHEGLAAGAFQALLAGQTEEHDRRIMAAAEELADRVELFVLAQASMGRLQEALAAATGKPVLTSPRLGVLAVAQRLEKPAS